MRKLTIMTYFFLFLFYFSLFFAATVNFSWYQEENVQDNEKLMKEFSDAEILAIQEEKECGEEDDYDKRR